MAKRSPEELLNLLKEQVLFIKKTCSLYDNGDEAEAKRLTPHIHILVHDDNRNIVSLLTQIGILNKLKFFSRRHPYRPTNLLSEARLCQMLLSSEGGKYIPALDEAPLGWQELSFSRWWNETVIFIRGNEHRELSRKNLICMMRDKDGGAHLDKIIPAYYSKLSQGENMGWQISAVNGKSFVPNVHYASVRQIAHEIIKTLTPILQS